MKTRTPVVLTLAALVSVVPAHYVRAQAGSTGGSESSKKKKGSVSDVLLQMSMANSALAASAAALPGKSPVERPFRSGIEQASTQIDSLSKLYASKSAKFLPTLDKLGVSVSQISAAWAALDVDDPEVGKNVQKLRDLSAVLQANVGAASLASRSGKKLTSEQKKKISSLRKQGNSLGKKLAGLKSKAKKGSPEYRMVSSLQSRAARIGSIDVTDLASFAALLGLLNALSTDYTAFGNVIEVADPDLFESWSSFSSEITVFGEFYESEEVFEEESWSDYEESFEEESESLEEDEESMDEEETGLDESADEDPGADDEEGSDEEGSGEEGSGEEGSGEEDSGDEDSGDDGSSMDEGGGDEGGGDEGGGDEGGEE